MILTIFLIVLAFFAGGWTSFFFTRKKMLFWRSQNLRSAEQAVHAGEVARRNFVALESQKRISDLWANLAVVTMFFACIFAICWQRARAKNLPAS